MGIYRSIRLIGYNGGSFIQQVSLQQFFHEEKESVELKITCHFFSHQLVNGSVHLSIRKDLKSDSHAGISIYAMI